MSKQLNVCTQMNVGTQNGLCAQSTKPTQGPTAIDLPSLFGKLKTYLQNLNNRRIDRAAFEHLLKLDDATLRDIGVTRADVTWAANLPLSEDSSAELEKIARGHKAPL